MELPGDYYHASASRSPSLHQSQPSPGFRNSMHSVGSQPGSDPRYSMPQQSPGLYAGYPGQQQQGQQQIPGYGQSFAAELAAPMETKEEHQVDRKY